MLWLIFRFSPDLEPPGVFYRTKLEQNISLRKILALLETACVCHFLSSCNRPYEEVFKSKYSCVLKPLLWKPLREYKIQKGHIKY